MNLARWIAGAAALLTAFAALGCADSKVIRVIDGVPVEGRFIPYEAYASYARGIEAQQDGHTRVAVRWFLEALRFDPESPEIWTRLGAAYCSAPPISPAEAKNAFEKAEQLDPRYEPLFRARARCAVTLSTVEKALVYAARAVALDPDQDEAVVLYANLLERSNKADEAARLLDGHVIRHPASVAGWRARYDLAQRQKDASAMERSARALVQLAPRMSSELTRAVPALAPLARVDDAIRQGNIEEARRAARTARLPPAELAVRAAAMGAHKLAREQAEHVLGADPASGSARVALAAASDAMADAQAVGLALDLPAGERLTPLSPLARLVFAELLARRADRDAARAFIGSLASDRNSDPVFESLRQHLVGRIGGTNAPRTGGI
jgi:tetratricopeptide (TPR) repeat protein